MSRSPRAASIASRISLAFGAADGDRRAAHGDADLVQESFRDRARRNDHRRMTGARALECVSHIVVPVLHDPGEIGMPGARERDRLLALAGRLPLGSPGTHPPRPVLVIAVRHDQRQRRAERASVPEPGQNLDLIGFNLLARAPAVTLLAAREVGLNRLPVELQPGREAGQDPDERGPVGLACRTELEGHTAKPSAAPGRALDPDALGPDFVDPDAEPGRTRLRARWAARARSDGRPLPPAPRRSRSDRPYR